MFTFFVGLYPTDAGSPLLLAAGHNINIYFNLKYSTSITRQSHFARDAREYWRHRAQRLNKLRAVLRFKFEHLPWHIMRRFSLYRSSSSAQIHRIRIKKLKCVVANYHIHCLLSAMIMNDIDTILNTYRNTSTINRLSLRIKFNNVIEDEGQPCLSWLQNHHSLNTYQD